MNNNHSNMTSQISQSHTFSQTGLCPFLISLFSHAGFNKPTPIQYNAIKTGLQYSQHSLMCRSKSGTGKTLAYLALLFHRLSTIQTQLQHKTYCIIVAPTRQLAVQIYQVLRSIIDAIPQIKCISQQDKQMKNKLKDINALLTIGGLSFEDDSKKYRQSPAHIVISTVGRLFEFFKTKNLILASSLTAIFDEGDKLLSNIDQKLKKVLLFIPANARWLIFSATFSRKMIKDVISSNLNQNKKWFYIHTLMNRNGELDLVVTDDMQKVIKEHVEIESHQNDASKGALTKQSVENNQNLHLQNIKKFQIKVIPTGTNSLFDQKICKLSKLLSELVYQKCLIFIQKKSFLQQLSQSLQQFQHISIHGSMSQASRFRMMNRINSTKIIIASDLLARGIDVKLDLVILFDARKGDTMWHRIGRTGRYGRQGVVVSLDAIQADQQWQIYDRDQVNTVLRECEKFGENSSKEWYGGHMTEIGKWEEIDQNKQAINNYKYYHEPQFQESVKQISKIENKLNTKIGQKSINLTLNTLPTAQSDPSAFINTSLSSITSKKALQKFIKQKILNCQNCRELMQGTTALTGYEFEILKYVQDQSYIKTQQRQP